MIMNWNQKNTVKKSLGFCTILYVWLWVCVLAYVGYSCILMCICMGLSEDTNTAHCLIGCRFVGVS